MATLLSYPDALSLASNLKKFSIAASEPISFKLYQSDELLLDETYTPNASGRIEIDVREIIRSQLSFILPTSDSFKQTALFKPFRALIDATEVSFVAIRSGVENFSDTAVNFLTANWLTWQPQTKRVAYSQPEWLTYYAPVACSVKVKFYLKNGTSEVVTLADQAAGTCFTYNVMYSYIMSIQDSECYGYYDVYVEDMAGTRLSYIQRYVYKKASVEDETYLFENSLGGLDTAVFNGALTFSPELEHTEGLYDDNSQQLETTFTRKYQQVTGNLSKVECSWIWDMFLSVSAYKLQSGTLRKITLIESSPERTSIEPLVSFPFIYRMSVDQGLQSVPRTMGTLPDNLEISTPEQLFFLAPRLVEFPQAEISSELLFPVQSPYTQEWKKLSYQQLISEIDKNIGEGVVRMEVDSSLGWMIGKDETTVISVKVYKRWVDITSLMTSWTWTRSSGDEADDLIWNQEHTTLTNSASISFADLGNALQTNVSCKFTIKATYDETTVSTTIEI